MANRTGDGRQLSGNVLIVEDDPAFGRLLTRELCDQGLSARRVESAEKALDMIRSQPPDLVVSDLRLPGMDGLDLLHKVKAELAGDRPDFLLITAFGSISRAVEALKAGAEDFLTKPLDLDHFMYRVTRILKNRGLRKEVDRIRSFLQQDDFHGMIGQSRPMRDLFDQINRVAAADGPVLILGESGTGKELVARAVLDAGRKPNGAFLAVNCAGIPEHLLESEFFGHKAGAFTGAGKARRGLFAEAEGGALLLDEIGEMPLFLQAKLLRMLQDGKIRPVGGDREEQVNVRILAATHQDLDQAVKVGRFRKDLFFRLETFTLRVPPLRERNGDLELLAARFLEHFRIQTGKDIRGFDQKALDMLQAYPFPGNVRELKNAVERAVTFCDGRKVLPEHFPARIRTQEASARERMPSPDMNEPQARDAATGPAGLTRLISLSAAEQRHIRHVLDAVGGNKRRAASILGIGRRTLYRKLERDDSDSSPAPGEDFSDQVSGR